MTDKKLASPSHPCSPPISDEDVCDEDVCLWADGTWCYRDGVESMPHMSDDYEILLFGTDRWWEYQTNVGID